MRLLINNIGIIKKADVDLNGITVICGNNNTGKSTVGKILFSIFNSCYKMDESILSQLITNLISETTEIIRSFIKDDNGQSFTFIVDEPFRCDNNTFLKFYRQLSDDELKGIKQVDEFIEAHLEYDYYDDIYDTKAMSQKIYYRIKDTLTRNIDIYKIRRVKSFFKGVFGNQLVNAKNESASVSTTIKGKQFLINFKDKDDPDMSLEFDFTNKAVYIDSPDRYRDVLSDWNIRRSDSENNTLYSLALDLLNSEYNDAADVHRADIENRLSKIDSIISEAVKGEFIRNNDQAESFKFENLDVPIVISNLSTGIKSFLLLRTLFKTGKITDRDVLILDEPEIHLHPEWQMLYAKTIVLLQKELGLTVLITSHSPAFVRSIECYCDYYDRMKELDVYKTKQISDFEYTLENLSYMNYGVSELYDDFSRPYSKLNDLLDKKYD